MINQEGSREKNLAAPCGIYCGNCRHYLARAKGLLKEKKLKHGCKGCRAQDKKCSWIKRDCRLIRRNHIDFCHECKDIPCNNLKKLHQRHLQDYRVNLLDNLQRIKQVGPGQWLQEQEEKWRCPRCGGSFCIMDEECYDCRGKMDED